MRILFFGDVMGRTGREALCSQLPSLRQQLNVDLVIVNGENAAGGYGLTAKICHEFKAAGANVITTGNHVWDQKEFVQEIAALDFVLRPANLPANNPGRGVGVFALPDGRKICVAHVLCQLSMKPVDSPFNLLEQVLAKHKLGADVAALVVDAHGELTSERMALGHFCDGKASMVVGSHTHVPTADAQILPLGTAYQTDAGMCGDYDSVIGMNKTEALFRFTHGLPTAHKLNPADGAATLCGVLVATDDKTGLATYISPIRTGGRLTQIMPD